MTSEVDIYATAASMIVKHGDKAAHEAALEAAALLKEGNPRASATWLMIIDAIQALQAKTPPGTKPN